MLNAVGLQNKGVNYFIENIYPRIRRCGSEIIVNVSGASVDDYVAVAERLSDLEDIHAIEVNISCPNVKTGRHGIRHHMRRRGVSHSGPAPRLGPHAHSQTRPMSPTPAEIARAVESEGAGP